MDGTVLVADDDGAIRTVLSQALTRAGCKVHATSSLTTLMRWVSEGRGDAIITDVRMPDGNGLEMLPTIAEDRPGLPVIVISAQNTIMTAIKAEELNAFDYLPKPFDLPELMKRCARALAGRNVDAGGKSGYREQPAELPLLGRTSVMQSLYKDVARLVNTDIPVFLTGESGTGKTLIMRTIHDFSDRRTLPYIVIKPRDLASIDGPEKILGRARGGTVAIDGFAEMDSDSQACLVRMMDADVADKPRYLAACLGHPSEHLKSGKLRDDLYYRLSGAVLEVPSLRDRIDDIELLANNFLLKAGNDGGSLHSISTEAMVLFKIYNWPGNIRQLENVVQRLAITARDNEIVVSEVQTVLQSQPDGNMLAKRGEGENLVETVTMHLRRYFDLHGNSLPPAGLYRRVVREVEMPLIEMALEATGGNQVKCAKLLGINRNTLRKKIDEQDIRVTRLRKQIQI